MDESCGTKTEAIVKSSLLPNLHVSYFKKLTVCSRSVVYLAMEAHPAVVEGVLTQP